MSSNISSVPDLTGRALSARSREPGEFGDRRDVDIEGIEKEPAVRRIGARPLRGFGKQRVQRIEPDPARSKLRRDRDQERVGLELRDLGPRVLHGRRPDR